MSNAGGTGIQNPVCWLSYPSFSLNSFSLVQPDLLGWRERKFCFQGMSSSSHPSWHYSVDIYKACASFLESKACHKENQPHPLPFGQCPQATYCGNPEGKWTGKWTCRDGGSTPLPLPYGNVFDLQSFLRRSRVVTGYCQEGQAVYKERRYASAGTFSGITRTVTRLFPAQVHPSKSPRDVEAGAYLDLSVAIKKQVNLPIC